MRKNIAILFATCLYAIIGYASCGAQSNSFNSITGRWSPDCGSMEGINISRNGKAIFSINSNQIYINVHAVQLTNNSFNLLLDSPSDLGAGGMNMPWKNFSKSKPVASFFLTSITKASLVWNGFYDTSSKKYQWTDRADFSSQNKSILFYKCMK